MEPYQLLIPELDPANPQILRILSNAEARLYEAFHEAVTASRKPGTQ